MLQVSVPLLAPMQSAPPPCGLGFVQFLVLVREPTPQVTEQLLQDDHWVQLPSTTMHINFYELSTCICSNKRNINLFLQLF